MASWFDPHPCSQKGVDWLKSKGMDQLNKRVWIDSRHHWRSTLYAFLCMFISSCFHAVNGKVVRSYLDTILVTLVLAGIITHQGNKTNGAYASVTINLLREYCLFAWLAALYISKKAFLAFKLLRIEIYERLKIGMATLYQLLQI